MPIPHDIDALLESDARFRQIVAALDQVFWVIDLQPHEHVPYVSPGFELIWGRSAAALYADPRVWTEAIVDADRPKVQLAFERWLADPDGERFTVEYRIRQPGGQLRWIADRGRAVRDAKGLVRRLTGIAEDITARKQAEEAAQSTERRFRQVVELLPQLVWTASIDGFCSYLSPQWVAYTGMAEAPQLGTGWLAQLHDEDRPRAWADWQRAVNSEEPYDTSFRLRAANGSYRWFKVRATLLVDEPGPGGQWFGTCTDVDDLTRMAASLTQERDRLAAIASAAPTAIHTLCMPVDGQPHIGFGADRVAHIYGLPAAQLAVDAQAMVNALHPEDAPHVHASVRDAAAAMTDWHAEYRVLHPTLGERWIEGRSTPVREPDGSLLWHGALTDITARKHNEQAVQASRAKLQTVFDHLNEGLVLAGADGTLLEWNRAALRLHGFDERAPALPQLAEMPQHFDLAHLDGRPLPRADWPLTRLLRGDSLDHEAVRVRHRQQGWERVFEYAGVSVHDAQGRILIGVLMVRDITARHRLERQMHELNQALEQRVSDRTAALQAAVKELEAFSYSVSHDLRAPLRALDGFSQALLKDHAQGLPPEGQRYLHIIRDSALKMGVLIDDLLAFSRIGRVALKSQALDTGMLVRDALAQLAPALENRQIDWQITGLPSCHGDLALLRQVWINLLSNAVKYTSKREQATIHIGVQPGPAGQPEFVVRDNGAGFDMRYAHKLFGVFERLHRTDEFEGTGVGLAIVQRILQRHGGNIRAEAVPGEGATFYFHLGPPSP
jgi:PAS domain S-box-containing protein